MDKYCQSLVDFLYEFSYVFIRNGNTEEDTLRNATVYCTGPFTPSVHPSTTVGPAIIHDQHSERSHGGKRGGRGDLQPWATNQAREGRRAKGSPGARRPSFPLASIPTAEEERERGQKLFSLPPCLVSINLYPHQVPLRPSYPLSPRKNTHGRGVQRQGRGLCNKEKMWHLN